MFPGVQLLQISPLSAKNVALTIFRRTWTYQTLAFRLGYPLERLRHVANQGSHNYREFPVKKGDKVRIIRPPSEELMPIQRRIKSRVLDRLPLDNAAHGGVQRRSPKTTPSCTSGGSAQSISTSESSSTRYIPRGIPTAPKPIRFRARRGPAT